MLYFLYPLDPDRIPGFQIGLIGSEESDPQPWLSAQESLRLLLVTNPGQRWIEEIKRLIRQTGRGRAGFAHHHGLSYNSLNTWLAPGGKLPDPNGLGRRLHDALDAPEDVRDLLSMAKSQSEWASVPGSASNPASLLAIEGTWYQVVDASPVVWQGYRWPRRTGKGISPTVDRVHIKPLNTGDYPIEGTIERLRPSDESTRKWDITGNVVLETAWAIYLQYIDDGFFSRGFVGLTPADGTADLLAGVYIRRKFTSDATPLPTSLAHVNRHVLDPTVAVSQWIVPHSVVWTRTNPLEE